MSRHELADALAFVDTAGMLLLDTAAEAQPDTAELAWQRDDPTAHYAQVHQATGMILVQLGVNAEAAFARLRAYAYAHDRGRVTWPATWSSGGCASPPTRRPVRPAAQRVMMGSDAAQTPAPADGERPDGPSGDESGRELEK